MWWRVNDSDSNPHIAKYEKVPTLAGSGPPETEEWCRRGESNPEPIANSEFTTSGQSEPLSGQNSLDPGHAKEVASDQVLPEGPSPGQLRHESGHLAAPTEPPLRGSELQTIAEVWPTLPAGFKKALVGLVAAWEAAERVERSNRAAAPDR